MNKSVTLLLLAALFSLSGCGYRLGTAKPSKLAAVKTLAIPTFENKTLVPRLEVMVTNAVIKKIQATGAYKIVNREQADATLVGEIVEIQRSQFRSVTSNTLQTSEIMARIRLNYYVVDRQGTKLLVGQRIGYSNIVLDPSYQITELQVLANAAERLGTEMASEMSEGW